MLTRILRSKFSFLLPLLVTFTLSLVLFGLTLIFLELAGTFDTVKQTPAQRVFQTLGDLTAIGAYVGFTFMLPLGAISTIILFVRLLLRRRNTSHSI